MGGVTLLACAAVIAPALIALWAGIKIGRRLERRKFKGWRPS